LYPQHTLHPALLDILHKKNWEFEVVELHIAELIDKKDTFLIM